MKQFVDILQQALLRELGATFYRVTLIAVEAKQSSLILNDYSFDAPTKEAAVGRAAFKYASQEAKKYILGKTSKGAWHRKKNKDFSIHQKKVTNSKNFQSIFYTTIIEPSSKALSRFGYLVIQGKEIEVRKLEAIYRYVELCLLASLSNTLVEGSDALMRLPPESKIAEKDERFVDDQIIDMFSKTLLCSALFFWQNFPDSPVYRCRATTSSAKPDFLDRDKVLENFGSNFRVFTGADFDDLLGQLPKALKDQAKPEKWKSAVSIQILGDGSTTGNMLVFFEVPRLPNYLVQQSILNLLPYIKAVVRDGFAKNEMEKSISNLESVAPLIFAGLSSSGKIHDVIGWLGNANVGVQVLLSKIKEETDEKKSLKSIRKNIESSISNCKSVMKFTDFSRFDDAEQDLQEIIKSCELSFASQIAEDQVDVNVVFKDVAKVIGDRDGLEQVFSNLISNSLYFLHEIPPRGEEAKVNILGYERETSFVVDILDNGPGINEADLERVFRFLYSTKGGNGTGVGLGMCKLILEHMRGSIRALPPRDKGAHFRITLPKGR